MLPIDQFQQASLDQKYNVVDQLFEPCDTLKRFIKPLLSNPFHSYPDFIEDVRKELNQLLESNDLETINKIIAAHPRLGEPKKNLSQHSSSEQKSIDDPETVKKLRQLNELYESTFPGLRYVVFVNGRSRDQIINNMNERIQRNNVAQERVDAFQAMCDIALDRVNKLNSNL